MFTVLVNCYGRRPHSRTIGQLKPASIIWSNLTLVGSCLPLWLLAIRCGRARNPIRRTSANLTSSATSLCAWTMWPQASVILENALSRMQREHFRFSICFSVGAGATKSQGSNLPMVDSRQKLSGNLYSKDLKCQRGLGGGGSSSKFRDFRSLHFWMRYTSNVVKAAN